MKTGTVVDAHNNQRQHMQKLLGTGAAMKKMSKEISKEVFIESNMFIRCRK